MRTKREQVGQIVTIVVAGLYLAFLWLDAVGVHGPERLLPPTLRFFSEAACLFPRAAQAAIEYRTEGWSCAEARWVELDPGPYFPIQRGDKENRFDRALHFYRRDRATMQALEAFLLERFNEAQSAAPSPVWIGGLRFSSLRIPIPSLGSAIERHQTATASSAADSADRETWYHTRAAEISTRCKRLDRVSR